jgi:hypothetical protein
MKKILDSGLPAWVESWYGGGLPMTDSEAEADIIVNPTHSRHVGKTIIINSPTCMCDARKLSMHNSVVARFPVEGVQEVIPYLKKEPRHGFTADISNGVITPMTKVDAVIEGDGFRLTLSRLCSGMKSGGMLTYLGFLYKYLNVVRVNSYIALKRFVQWWEPNMESLSTMAGTVIRFPSASGKSLNVIGRRSLFHGPVMCERRPNKRMNVKNGYSTSVKYKTYRITDKLRSYDLRYNPGQGYCLFALDRAPDLSDVMELAEGGGMEIVLYLLFFFAKKNHFRSISGDVFSEQLRHLEDPGGKVSLRITLLPEHGAMDDESEFRISVLGRRRQERDREYMTLPNK